MVIKKLDRDGPVEYRDISLRWIIGLLKYFSHVGESYSCAKYFATSIYIFKFISNFTDVIPTVGYRRGANKISKRCV